jgi:outer membrane biosynthesis protein TonB
VCREAVDLSKPARRLRISFLSCLLAAWPLYAGTQPPAAAPERLAVSRTVPADSSQDPLQRWFAEQDKILDDILTRLVRIETLVSDIHRLISKLPSPAPTAAVQPQTPAVPPKTEVSASSEPPKPTAAPAPSATMPAPAAPTPAVAPAPVPPAEPQTQAAAPAKPVPASPPAKPKPPVQPDDFEEEGFAIADWMPQLAGAGALLLVLLLWQRRRNSSKKPAPVKPAATTAPEAKAAAAPPPLEKSSVQEAKPQTATAVSQQLSAAPAKAPFVDTGSVDLDLGTDSDQSDQALELADIMLSMGLGQGAAQTLTEQIRNEPKQALRHWLKLLEVYRRNGQQAEFERSAEELRQHFNVKPEDWHAQSGTQHSVEDYPHIASRLTELWGKPACLVYLKNLLADNRGGARAGFPQSVAEELLMLSAILRGEGFLS